MRYQRFNVIVAALSLVLLTSCATITQAPPNLSPQGQTAFRSLQLLKVLDLIRDVAIDANAQQPPLVSTDTTRRIVLFHQSAIKLIDAQTVGWTSIVYQQLVQLNRDVPAEEKGFLGGYLTLGLQTLKGLL